MKLPACSQEWSTADKSHARQLMTDALQVLWRQNRDAPDVEAAHASIELCDALGVPQTKGVSK